MTVQIKTKFGVLIEIEDVRFGDTLDFSFMCTKIKADGYLMLRDFFIDYGNIDFISHSATPTQVPQPPLDRRVN